MFVSSPTGCACCNSTRKCVVKIRLQCGFLKANMPFYANLITWNIFAVVFCSKIPIFRLFTGVRMFSVILHTFIITIILIFVNAFIKNLPTHSKMYRQFILCQNFLKRLYLISTSFSGSISDFLSKVCAIRFFRLSNSLLSTSLGSLIILSITPILNRS